MLLFPLFHPAAGLRTPAVADQLREDFELIPELLASPLPEGADEPHEEPAAASVEADQLGLFGGTR